MTKNLKPALPLLLGNCLVLFLLLAGGLFSFTTAYEIRPDSTVLLAGCGGAAALFAVLWSVPRGGWAAGALLGAEIFVIWRQWEWLEPAAELLGAAALGTVRSDSLEFARMKVPASGPLTGTLLLLVFAGGCVLGWLAVRERCWHLTAVLAAAPLLAALLFGTLPDLMPLMAQVAGWGSLLLSSLYNRRDARSLGRGLWLSLGGMAAFLLLLLALMPQEGYTRPEWATNARDGLVDSLSELFAERPEWDDDGNWSFPSLDMAAGPTGPGSEVDGEVDLAAAGPRRYAGTTVMQITGGEPGRIYLRGGASGVYSGDGWTDFDDRFYAGSMAPAVYDILPDAALYPAWTAPAEAPVVSMTVRHMRGGGSAAYVPYRLLDFPGGLAYLSGSGNAVRTMEEYMVEYVPGGPEEGGFVPLSGTAAGAEGLYRQIVYQLYLDVPEAVDAALRPLLEQVREQDAAWPVGLPEQFRTAAAAAMATAQTLSGAAYYDLNVPAMEPGEDFAAHFLEEGRGYCVHFATAGALLLRMQGIPARYVEGYAPWVNEDGTASVKDRDAHAWVEIYLDGYGWYPVEMTPGRQGESPDSITEEILQTEAPPIPELEPEAPEDREPGHEEEPEKEEPETPDAVPEPDAPGEPDGTEKEQPDFSWVRKAAALLVPAALYGAYRLADVLRRRKRENPNMNQSVIYAYLRYQKMREWGGPEEPVLEELGRKAKFSQHTLSGGEKDAAWACVAHEREETAKQLNWWRRALFSVVFGST